MVPWSPRRTCELVHVVSCYRSIKDDSRQRALIQSDTLRYRLIRCHFCNETISPRKEGTISKQQHPTSRRGGGGGGGADSNSSATGPAPTGLPTSGNVISGGAASATTTTIPAMTTSTRVTRCPNCHKAFPRCAICLESIEVSRSGGDPTPAWCWCQ